MYVSNPRKTIRPAVLGCGGTAVVTISFDAAAELPEKPADIVLVMDHSSSMTEEQMSYARAAAKRLIATVAEASGGTDTIENGSRMGLVSFCTNAEERVALTDRTGPLLNAVDSLQPYGTTNHREAFETAEAMLRDTAGKRRIVVMFTDGETTTGGDPAPVAQRIKASGAEIDCIGLRTDPAPLNLWASDPDSEHVVFTDDPQKLGELFRKIAAGVVLAGVQDAEIHEKLTPDFELIEIGTPTDGTAERTGDRTLLWTIDAAGFTEKPETVSLACKNRHVGESSGVKEGNKALTYEDRAGNQLRFPGPKAEIHCETHVVYPEPCPVPAEITAEHCRDAVTAELPGAVLPSLGRIVTVTAVVKNVCPGKRVAAAITLSEEGEDGTLHPRGTKMILIPAQAGTECRDVVLKCVRFVVPEALDETGDPGSICNERHFRAGIFANYVDTDFVCCDADTPVV